MRWWMSMLRIILRKRSTAAEVLRILQTEQVKRGEDLSAKLAALMEFRRKNLAVSFDTGQGNFVLQQMEKLSSALTEARMATVESGMFYESVQAMANNPVALAQLIETQGTTAAYLEFTKEQTELQTKLNDLRIRLADRSRQLTDDHPAIVSLTAEIQRIEEKMKSLHTEYAEAQLAVAKQKYEGVQRKQEQIARQFDERQEEYAGLNEKLTEYLHLQSEYEQTKKLCDVLDERIKEINVTEDAGALNISILEVARPADRPSEPQKAKVLALALALGLMVGVGLALLRQTIDQRLRSVDEVSALLGMPVLGVVPAMSRREDRSTLGRVTVLRRSPMRQRPIARFEPPCSSESPRQRPRRS